MNFLPSTGGMIGFAFGAFFGFFGWRHYNDKWLLYAFYADIAAFLTDCLYTFSKSPLALGLDLLVGAIFGALLVYSLYRVAFVH